MFCEGGEILCTPRFELVRLVTPMVLIVERGHFGGTKAHTSINKLFLKEKGVKDEGSVWHETRRNHTKPIESSQTEKGETVQR
jgi:hypothetical protein